MVNVPLLGNLNSTHVQVMIAVALLLVFSYVDDGKLVEGPLQHLGDTGTVLAILGVVYLNALANSRRV